MSRELVCGPGPYCLYWRADENALKHCCAAFPIVTAMCPRSRGDRDVRPKLTRPKLLGIPGGANLTDEIINYSIL